MNRKILLTITSTLLLGLSFLTSTAFAGGVPGYGHSSRGSVATNSSGECWHSSYSKKHARQGCDLADADHDGVNDSKDKCPGTTKGAHVHADGCNPDADHDGVRSFYDKCPGTPAGADVDTNGCHTPAPVAPAVKLVDTTVHFGFDSAKLNAAATAALDAVAGDLAAAKEVHAVGFTDSVGSSDYNNALAAERAHSVKSYLVGKGVSADKIGTGTQGEASPADSNDTEAGRASNRRVHVFSK